MENAVTIKNVTMKYDDTSVLEDINLEIKEKDFLAILGPNGGGKSTLLKLILGLKKQNVGSIEIFGENVKSNRKIVGYVPQFTKFDKKFPISVTEVVLMGTLNPKIKLFHKYSNEDINKAYEIMKKLDIYKFKDRQIGKLSGGQMQRVLIARAMLVQPKILLLDEPTASLDTNAKHNIYELLKDLNKDITVVIITHDIGMIASYASSMVCINKKIYYSGKVKINEKIIENIYSYSEEKGEFYD